MSAEGRDEAPGVNESEALLAVARLHRAHGLAGESRVEPLVPAVVDFAELARGREFALRRDGRIERAVRIETMRPHQGGYLIKLEHIDNREDADRLKGSELCLARADLPELSEGWFWEDDLVGLTVRDARRGEIGLVEGLQAMGSELSLKIARAEGEPRVFVPWKLGLVVGVDLKARMIEVELPDDYPGLEEER